MVPLIVLIVVLAAGGGIAFVVKSKKAATAASDEAGSGPNEFLRSPPTSFPSTPGAQPSLEAGADASSPETEPASAPVVAGGEEVARGVDDLDGVDDAEEDDDDEVVVARFKAPGARSTGANGPARPAVTPPVYHLEGPPSAAAPELDPESEPDADVETGLEPVAVVDDGPVIDLSGEQAVVTPADAVVIRRVEDPADDRAWEDVVLQSEPDAVDHVLEALINRSRFKQVEVEAVATELVERADLQGQEVSDVLAELVGRADGSTLDATRTSELTLFNDEVPSRPGQLTDFAVLAPAEKKRIIVRVLCLLVARSEDQQLPPRAEGDPTEPKAWPLARAVWPLAASEDDGEAQLPSRRLAKSG